MYFPTRRVIHIGNGNRELFSNHTDRHLQLDVVASWFQIPTLDCELACPNAMCPATLLVALRAQRPQATLGWSEALQKNASTSAAPSFRALGLGVPACRFDASQNTLPFSF